MKSRFTQQALPAIIMAGAAVVPVATVADILNQSLHSSATGGAIPAASGPLAQQPSAGSAGTAGTGTARNGTYKGPVVDQPYGPVQAAVTVSGRKITSVAISAPRNNAVSASINSQAVPLLRQETLQAQSGNISFVSGATLTSQAYAQSLQAALNQAGSQGNTPIAGGSPATTGKRLAISGSHHDDGDNG